MKHTVFALFDTKQAADQTISELVEEDRGLSDHISLLVHEDILNAEQLDHIAQHTSGFAETDHVRGIAMGALIGGGIGAVLGTIVAGPLGLLAAGPFAGIFFGGGAGSVYGMLAAGLSGAGLTDHTLKKLAKKIEAGNVLLLVRAPSRQIELKVEEILRDGGAIIAEKHLI